MRGDEILGIMAAQAPIADMFMSEALVDHPPLYFLLLRAWLLIAGDSDFAIRFLSVCFSTVVVLVIYQVGHHLMGQSVGIVAGAVAAASPFSIVYSQEARAYALAVLLATVSVYLVLLLVDGAGHKAWLVWAAVSMLAIFSEYTAGLVIAFEEMFLVFYLLRRRCTNWQSWALAQIVIFGPLLPWLYFSQAVMNIYVYDSAAWGIDLGDMLRETASRFSIGNSLARELEMPFTMAFVGLAALGLVHSRRSLRSFLYMACYVAVPVAITYAVSLGVLGFAARHLLVAIPAFFLLVAAGLIWLKRRSWLLFMAGSAVVAIGSAIALLNYYTEPAYAREDLRNMARFVEQEARPNDLVIFTAPWGEKMFRYYSDAPIRAVGLPLSDRRDRSHIEESLRASVAGRDRVWLVLYLSGAADPEGNVEKWLNQNTHPLGATAFHKVAVRSFLASSPVLSASPAVQHPIDKVFGGKLRLLGYQVDDTEATTKGRLHVALYWRSLQNMDRNYRIQLRVIDKKQNVWALRDNQPVKDALPTTRWATGIHVRDEYTMELLSGTPPGSYYLTVQVYEPGISTPLMLAPGVQQIVMGQVEVPRRMVTPAPNSEEQVKTWQDFGNIELLGYGVWDRLGRPGRNVEAKGGDKLTVSTLWQASSSLNNDVAVSLVLQGQGHTFSNGKKLVGGDFPTSRWQAGDLIRDFQTLVIDPEAPPGKYRLLASLDKKDQLTLGTVTVGRIERQFTPSLRVGTYTIDGSFDNGITLLGYDLNPAPQAQLKPSANVRLTLYWTTSQKIPVQYTAFAHLVDATDRIVGQHDAEPASNTRPTTSWLPDELVIDRHLLPVARDSGSGTYRIFVGLYDPQTGQRLRLVNGGDRLLINEMSIRSGN